MKNLAKKSAFSGLAVLVIGVSLIQQQAGEVDFSADFRVYQEESLKGDQSFVQTNFEKTQEVSQSPLASDSSLQQDDKNKRKESEDSKKEAEVVSNEKFQEKDSEVVKPSSGNRNQNDGQDKMAESARSFTATAYCLKGRTASGAFVRRGIIAADPKVLPMGSLVQLTAGSYSGTYVVADTGRKVKGRKIDVWVPKCSEAIRFGRRNVKLTVIQKRK